MKQGLNPRRSRGRSNGRGRNPNVRTQQFDSSGPEGRVRGTASQVYERYLAQARDAQSSGDTIAAENLFQHAEHYFRILNAQNASNPQYQPARRDGDVGRDRDGGRDDSGPDEDEHGDQERGYSPRDDNGRDDERLSDRGFDRGASAPERRRPVEDRPAAEELPRFITEREPATADSFQESGGGASQGLFADLEGDRDPPPRRGRPRRERAPEPETETAEAAGGGDAAEPQRSPRRLNGHTRGRRRTSRPVDEDGATEEAASRGPADAEV